MKFFLPPSNRAESLLAILRFCRYHICALREGARFEDFSKRSALDFVDKFDGCLCGSSSLGGNASVSTDFHHTLQFHRLFRRRLPLWWRRAGFAGKSLRGNL